MMLFLNNMLTDSSRQEGGGKPCPLDRVPSTAGSMAARVASPVLRKVGSCARSRGRSRRPCC
eukprot:500921-Alexandrium_andersonii.AAC.1